VAHARNLGQALASVKEGKTQTASGKS